LTWQQTVTPNFVLKLNNKSRVNGKILILRVQINDLRPVCTDIYTPNDSRFQIIFIGQLQNLLQQFSGENIIVGGDLNSPFAEDDKEEDRDLFSKKSVVGEIKVLLSSLG